MYLWFFYISSSVKNHFGCFWTLDIMYYDKEWMINMQKFPELNLIFCSYKLRSTYLLSWNDCYILTMQVLPHYLMQWLGQFILPPTMQKDTFFSRSLQLCILICFFCNLQLRGIQCCGFNINFCNQQWCEHFPQIYSLFIFILLRLIYSEEEEPRN